MVTLSFPEVKLPSFLLFSSINSANLRGTCKIKFETESLDNATATLSGHEIKNKIPAKKVIWHFGGLSQRKQVWLLTEQQDCLDIEVKGNSDTCEIHLHVNKGIYQKAREYHKFRKHLETMNQVSFTRENERLEGYVKKLQMKKEKWCRVMQQIMESSKDYPANANASANAITAWVRAGYSLNRMNLSRMHFPRANLMGVMASRANFEGVNLTQAVLDNACIAGTSFKNANLTSTTLVNAIMNCAIFEGAIMVEIRLGQWPMIHCKNIVQTLCIATDEKQLIGGINQLIYIWDLETGDELRVIQYRLVVNSLTFF